MRETWRRWLWNHYLEIVVTILLAAFVLVLLAPRIFISVPSGYTGAKWSRFFGGTDLSFNAHEGLNLVFPWDHITLYDVRLSNYAEHYDILAQDGLRLDVDVLVRFRPNSERIGVLHRYIGPEYLERLIAPQVGASTRERMAAFTPEEVYTLRRAEVQQEILTSLRNRLAAVQTDEVGGSPPLVYIHDLSIRSVRLPSEVQAAIELKMVQSQREQQYTSILSQERQEAERKRIEARGIKDFQDVVNGSITSQYLSWKGIDATLRLAESNNAKVVIVGGGQSGLPIILGDDFGKTSPATGAATGGGGSSTVTRQNWRGPSSSNSSTMTGGVLAPPSVFDRSLTPEARSPTDLPRGTAAPAADGVPRPGFTGNR